MIQLSARGFSAQEIAEIHDCADVTVYEWMDRFDAEGPEGLCDRKQEGRPPKIDKEAEAALERLEYSWARSKRHLPEGTTKSALRRS